MTNITNYGNGYIPLSTSVCFYLFNIWLIIFEEFYNFYFYQFVIY